MEGQMPRRVPWDVDDPKGPDLFAFAQGPVDGARHVLRASKRKTDPHRIRGKRTLRSQANGLCHALPRDDVSLPLVGAHERSAEPLEGRHAAEVGAMGVGERDVLEVAWGPADPPDALEYTLSVGVEQGVHQGELALVLEEIRAGAPALPLADGVHALGYTHRSHSTALDRISGKADHRKSAAGPSLTRPDSVRARFPDQRTKEETDDLWRSRAVWIRPLRQVRWAGVASRILGLDRALEVVPQHLGLELLDLRGGDRPPSGGAARRKRQKRSQSPALADACHDAAPRLPMCQRSRRWPSDAVRPLPTNCVTG